MKENPYNSTKGDLNIITSQNDSISEREKESNLYSSYYKDDEEQNPEFISQEIPVNINDISEIRSKTNLSLEQERIIQKLPTFRIDKINDDIINSDKYLDLKEYKPLIIRNPPLFFWFLGFCFISFDIILIINIILYQIKKNFLSGFIGHYAYEFIILIVILLFGASFFIYAEYESIHIDMIKGIMKLYKYNTLTCSFNILEIELNSINSIFPTKVQSIRTSNMGRTCLTQIGITFNNSNTVYVFKSLFRYFTIKNVIKIRTFLYKRLQSYEMVERELDGTISYINVLQERIR